MSSGTAALTKNQQTYEDLKGLAEKGFGIEVGRVERDGVMYKRYVIPYTTEGNPVRTSDLKRTLDSEDMGLAAPKIKQINQLAKTVIDSHRKNHDSSTQEKRQNAFFNREGFHYVKSDEIDRDDSHEHLAQPLKADEYATYSSAFGPSVDGMIGEHKNVLDLKAKLTGKTIEDTPKEDLDRLLQGVQDKNFVRIFRKVLAEPSRPDTPLTQIYTKALQLYVKETVKTFRVSLDPTSLEDVTKELNKAAHTKFDPVEANPSETWLTDNVDELGNTDNAKVVFQAIHEVGSKAVDADNHTSTTAEHAYQALVTKVNDYWLEANRLAAIDHSVVIEIPEDPRSAALHGSSGSSTGVHGSSTPERMEVAKAVLSKPDVEGKIKEIDQKIEKAKEHIAAIDHALPSAPYSDPFELEAAEKVGEAAVDFPEVVSLEPFDAMSRLRAKITELEEEKATQTYLADPLKFQEEIDALKEQRRLKVGEKEKAYRLSLLSPTKGAIQTQIDALDVSITRMERVLTKRRTPEEKVTLLKTLLHQPVSSAVPKYADYNTLITKVLTADTYPNNLTEAEVAALQTWQIPESVDKSDAGTLLSNLRLHLDGDAFETRLPEIKAKVLSVDTTSVDYQGYTYNKGHYRAAYDFLQGKGGATPSDLDDPLAKGMLYALRVAHEDPTNAPKDADSPAAWRVEMSKILKAKEFEAIGTELE
ncbi:hypothetical protein [Simkania sp.]|uniref:hypothetical protein n=1 Tax=Simkania sp. TaxID=34094 RepID=UPI003B52C588